MTSSQTPLPRVVEIARDLIRFDTTNFGLGKAKGEREAAKYVQGILSAIGIESTLFEKEPGRTSVIARVPGVNPSLGALVVHGHLDVVPADETVWQVDPFAGEIRDGYLWGRGAVDMKNMNAMILSSLEELHAAGQQPRRDLIIAFFADEEDGGGLGAHYLVSEHPELFDGATEAISEVGGYSVTIADHNTYLIQTGEKSLLWLTIHISGRAGHGSILNEENALIKLAEAIHRLDQANWPITLTRTTSELLHKIAELHHLDFGVSTPEAVAELSGAAAPFVRATLQTTVNVTGLQAGIKHNVVPGQASAWLDVRTLPGEEDQVLRTLQNILGDEFVIEVQRRDIGLETEFSGELVDAMIASLKQFEPDALILPYMLSGGTDNKALSRLGIRGFGFVPLKLPPELDFPRLFHGVDERVPLESLVLGKQILHHLLSTY